MKQSPEDEIKSLKRLDSWLSCVAFFLAPALVITGLWWAWPPLGVTALGITVLFQAILFGVTADAKKKKLEQAIALKNIESMVDKHNQNPPSTTTNRP